MHVRQRWCTISSIRRPSASKMCCVQAYEQLQRSLLPVLHQLEGLDEGSEQADARDWSSLQMLARRTKNQLVLD